MSYKLFKNQRAARRHLPKVDLNILAVDKCLKPSYLWDTFDAKPKEIESYVNHLLSSGVIETNLNVIVLNDNIFITHLKHLEVHLNNVLESRDNLFVIDVSKQRIFPGILPLVEKEKILQSVVDSFYSQLACNRLNAVEQDSSSVITRNSNLTTLFGVLLGYPVLYWYDCQRTKECDDLTCLSMLPLKVHKVIASVNTSNCEELRKSLPLHELYSFSIPDMLFKESSELINSWMKKIQISKSEDCIFQDLEMICDTVTLPYVVL